MSRGLHRETERNEGIMLQELVRMFCTTNEGETQREEDVGGGGRKQDLFIHVFIAGRIDL